MARAFSVGDLLYSFCIMIAILSDSSYIENILSFLGILSHDYSLMHGSVCIVKQLPAVLVCILNRQSIQRVVTYSISTCYQAYLLGWSASRLNVYETSCSLDKVKYRQTFIAHTQDAQVTINVYIMSRLCA